MTSSGIATFAPTVADYITRAYRECGVIHALETPSGEQYATGLFKLNAMTAEWGGAGKRVWSIERAILFLQKGQSRYQLGRTATDHATDRFDFASTTLTAAVAAGATALTVDSITDIAASDYLGIELDSGYFQFTTVNGAPAGSTVTATAALTGAAALGNRVVAYTTKIIRPLKVVQVSDFNYESLIETDKEMLANLDYQRMPNKTTNSSPFVQPFYQPKIPLGVMSIWQPPSDVKYAMTFSYQRPLFDFTTLTDTADFPPMWANAIIFGLAAELVPGNDVPPDRADIIFKMAIAKLQTATGNDIEPESILMQPDMGSEDQISWR
jgi:hypothetical protein